MGSKKTRAAVSAVTYILISILAVICVFPFFWMLISALKPKDEIRSAVPSLLIDNPTIDNFRRVLVDNGFLTYIKNSFVVSLAATLISMIIAVLIYINYTCKLLITAIYPHLHIIAVIPQL